MKQASDSAGGITARLTCVTYNIHSGIGTDKRYDLARIRRVIADERADIIALQEVECGLSRSSSDDQPAALAHDLQLAAQFCSARRVEHGAFGLAVLSRYQALQHQQYDLTYSSNYEPRFCQRVDLSVAPGAVLHVFNCHLGLAARERAFQRDRMLSDAILLSEDLHHPVLLMGDFNDSPISVVHRRLRRHFVDAYSAAGKRWGPTFKLGPIPLRLDHIYCSRNIRVLECRVRHDEVTRAASDHRPVIASLELTWPSSLATKPRGPA